MKKELEFAYYAIKKNIKGSTELRTSFIINIFGMAFNNIAFIILWFYFAKSVGDIGGWAAYDVIGLQGLVTLSFGVIFSFAGGFQNISEYISSGAFDRFMISPKNLILRMTTSSFDTSALGDILFGAISLGIYLFLISASFSQIVLTILFILISCLVFFSVMLFITATGFYFSDPMPVITGLRDLFFSPALFHGGAFQGATRFIFTFIIPSLVIGTLPIETIKSQSLETFILITIISIVWFLGSLVFFSKALRKYESSNFATFGI